MLEILLRYAFTLDFSPFESAGVAAEHAPIEDPVIQSLIKDQLSDEVISLHADAELLCKVKHKKFSRHDPDIVQWLCQGTALLVKLLGYMIHLKDDASLVLALKLLKNIVDDSLQIISSYQLDFSPEYGRDPRLDWRQIRKLKENIQLLLYRIHWEKPELDQVTAAITNAAFSCSLRKALFLDDIPVLEELLTSSVVMELWQSGKLEILAQGLSPLWPLRKPQIVELLLEHGYKNLLDEPVEEGYPPLCYAAAQGWKEEVLALLALGADVNAVRLGWNETPLFAAAGSSEENADDIIKILLAHGADPRISDGFDCLPWRYVIERHPLRALRLRAAQAEIDINEEYLKFAKTKQEEKFVIAVSASPHVEEKRSARHLPITFFSPQDKEAKLGKANPIQVKLGIKACAIPLPLCMMAEAYELLPGLSSNKSIVDGCNFVKTCHVILQKRICCCLMASCCLKTYWKR